MARLVPLVSLLLALVLVGPTLAAAQEATPTSQPTTGVDPANLAAMALAPEDLPAGFFDEYSEWWLPGEFISDAILGGEAAPAGLERLYQSFGINRDNGDAINMYLFEFDTPDAAEAGIGSLDGVLQPPLPPATTTGPSHAPGPVVGDDASVTTLVSFDSRAEGGPLVEAIATTFRQDRIVAGVSIEQWTEPDGTATPAAAVATPTTPDPTRQQLSADLAIRLSERIGQVMAGEAPAGIDPALPGLVLPLDQLVDGPTPVLGGYKGGADMLRCGVCGEENSLLPFTGDALGGFAREVVIGPLVDGEPTPPFVTVSVSAFASPDTALAVLDAIRAEPNDLPTSVPIPRGQRTLTADPTVPGATAAIAYQGSLDDQDPNAPLDSAGVVFVLNDRLVTVDVQGGLAAEAALAVATDLATQQATCLTSGTPCDSVTRPQALDAA